MKHRWPLVLLTLIATVQFFDRAMMVIVVEPTTPPFTMRSGFVLA